MVHCISVVISQTSGVMFVQSSNVYFPFTQAEHCMGDYLHPAFVCSEFLSSLAGTVQP